MNKFTIIAILVLLGNITLAQQEKKAHHKTISDIQWISFEELSNALKVQPKKVLLFFHTEWCVYCRKMMKETFSDPNIVDEINKNYYAVHFDAESTDTILFDGTAYNNLNKKKKNGSFHEIAQVFLETTTPIFPTTILYESDFTRKKNKQKYLSISELSAFLQN